LKHGQDLQLAASAEEFLRAPVGRYLASDHFVVWCPSNDFCGTVSHGGVARGGARVARDPRSRVRAATTLVANSSHKIETVARMVGVASAFSEKIP